MLGTIIWISGFCNALIFVWVSTNYGFQQGLATACVIAVFTFLGVIAGEYRIHVSRRNPGSRRYY